MNLTGLEVGTVYRLKHSQHPNVLLQVCPGGDSAVFKVNSEFAGLEPSLMAFRAIINGHSVRTRWKNLGKRPLHPANDAYYPYSEKDECSGELFKIYLSDLDDKIPIDYHEFSTLERLVIWDTDNVIDRLAGVDFFREE